jgi:hypothetical protein
VAFSERPTLVTKRCQSTTDQIRLPPPKSLISLSLSLAPPRQTSQTAPSARLDISTAGNSNKPISAILRPFPPEVAFQQLQLAIATPTSTAIRTKWAKLASQQVASQFSKCRETKISTCNRDACRQKKIQTGRHLKPLAQLPSFVLYLHEAEALHLSLVFISLACHPY